MWSFLRPPAEPGVLSDPDGQRRFAILVTRQVWNATPLPGNGYRPKPLRNRIVMRPASAVRVAIQTVLSPDS